MKPVIRNKSVKPDTVPLTPRLAHPGTAPTGSANHNVIIATKTPHKRGGRLSPEFFPLVAAALPTERFPQVGATPPTGTHAPTPHRAPTRKTVGRTGPSNTRVGRSGPTCGGVACRNGLGDSHRPTPCRRSGLRPRRGYMPQRRITRQRERRLAGRGQRTPTSPAQDQPAAHRKPRPPLRQAVSVVGQELGRCASHSTIAGTRCWRRRTRVWIPSTALSASRREVGAMWASAKARSASAVSSRSEPAARRG